jgi:cytochrome c oxidase subunit IV
MSHASSHHEHAGHDDHGGIAKYIFVFFALCVLTTMSFFTYSRYWPWHDEPAVGRMFMTAVSCTKAMLVILFFMHVKYEANWKYVLTIPASIMSVFLCLALVPDIGARVHGLFGYHGKYSEERREHIGRVEDEEHHDQYLYDANALMKKASIDAMHHAPAHESSHNAAPSEEQPAPEASESGGAAPEEEK